jgi:hypothetical protein
LCIAWKINFITAFEILLLIFINISNCIKVISKMKLNNFILIDFYYYFSALLYSPVSSVTVIIKNV